jgi:hypothetical protein
VFPYLINGSVLPSSNPRHNVANLTFLNQMMPWQIIVHPVKGPSTFYSMLNFLGMPQE